MDKWLNNNNVVRIIALILGVLLWVVVEFDANQPTGSSGAQLQTHLISSVSITPIYDESVWHISSIQPETVSLQLRGRDAALRRVNNPNQYEVRVDLRNAVAGEQQVPIEVIGLPSGVEASVLPSSVWVTLEEVERKEVPVVVNVTGTPAEGYRAGSPIVRPGRVVVTAPSSTIEFIDNVQAQFNVDGASDSIIRQVTLRAYDSNNQLIEANIQPQVVEVEVPITLPFVQIPLQVRLIGNASAGFAIADWSRSTDLVQVYGQPQDLEQLEFYDGLEWNISQLTEDATITLDIPLRSPFVRVEPAQVQISVRVVQADRKLIPAVPLQVEGINNDLQLIWESPPQGSLSVTLEGATERLDALDVDTIRATVDVSGLGEGQHAVEIQWSLPQFVKVIGTQIATFRLVDPDAIEPLDPELDGDADEISGEPDNGEITDPVDGEPAAE